MVSCHPPLTIYAEQKFTPTHQNCVTCARLSKPHAHLWVRLMHTCHTCAGVSVQPIIQSTPCREHSHSLASGDQSRLVCNTSTFDIIRCIMLLFESLNNLLTGSLCIFIPCSVNLHPLQQHIHMTTVRCLANFSPLLPWAINPARHTESFQAL